MSDMLNTVAPEFDADALRDEFLDIAASLMSATAWGAQFALAQAYLAAHMLKQMRLSEAEAGAGAGSGSGAITSLTDGDLSISYGSASSSVAAMTAGDAELAETRYGRAFLRIRSTRAAGRPTVIIPG